MPVSADILPPHPDGDDLFCLDALIDRGPAMMPARTPRADGWTPGRQRKFLEMLAEGHTITNICLALGMSVASAYALRRSARGAAFALGWQAALLLAREHLADTLLERAVHGSVETVTRPDGATITRQRHDNRLAMHMLTRLDRLSERDTGPADHEAARLVAGEFEPYLELVEREGGAARAGLFLARRLGAEGVDGQADDLAPVRALARADAWLRTHGDGAAAPDVADLDPAQRASWTAEQWARAEAAGLLALAPSASRQDAHEPQLPQLRDFDPRNGDPVWWDSDLGEWRTRFPPPERFYGEEYGDYGDPHYARALSPEELEVLEAPLRAARETRRVAGARERDAYFADGIDVIEVDARGVPLWGEPEAETETEAEIETSAPAEAASAAESCADVSDALPPPRSSSPRRRGSMGAGVDAQGDASGGMDSRPREKDEGHSAGAATVPVAPPLPASSQPGTAAAAPGLTPPTEAPISRSGRAPGAAKRQRIREGTMPSNDQSRPTAPARAAALN